MKKHTLFIILIIGIALAIGIWRDNQDITPKESAQMFTSLPLSVGTALQPHRLPEFTLTDMNGNAFTNQSLKEHWSFIFFGYTHCPDVCPTTLGSLKQISQRLGNGANVQFLFISIDPEHDTPNQLKTFLQQAKFHPTSFIGLTGDKAKIKQLANVIGIHVAENQDKTVSTEHIEHGGSILLINPEGKLAAIFTSTDKPNAIVKDFKDIVHHYVNDV
jgi:protein SCO1/2